MKNSESNNKKHFIFTSFYTFHSNTSKSHLPLPSPWKLFCSRNVLVLWLCSTDGWWRVRRSDFWTPWQRISGAAEGERGPPASGERTKQMGLHTNNAKHQTQPAKEPGRHRRWNATQKRSLLMRLPCSFCLRSSAPRPRHTVDSKTSVYLIAVPGNCTKCKTEPKKKAVIGLKHSISEAWVDIRMFSLLLSSSIQVASLQLFA